MKKFFMYITLLCITFAMCINVYAIDDINVVDCMLEKATSSQKAQIIDILNFVELGKEDIGLGNVDFSQLKIGNKLNRYMITDNGIEISGYSYPILYDNEVVLIATSSSGKFQITTYEAEAIRNSEVDNVALVYDEYGLCLFDGIGFIRIYPDTLVSENNLYTNLSITEDCASCEGIASTATGIVLTDLRQSESLYSQNSCDTINYSPTAGYHSAPVDFVSQNDDDTCWAACVAMLTNTIKNIYYSAEDIAIAYLGEDNMNDGLSFDKVGEILRGDVNYSNIMDEDILEDCACDEDYDYNSSLISDEKIAWCMDDWRPIVAGFKRTGGNQGHHAVVIDAIHRAAGYVRVCDPNFGRVYSYKDDVNEDQSYYGKYTYTNPNNNRFYYMVEQISTWH